MSDEVGKVAEQNSALLSFLEGHWTTKFTAYVHSVIVADKLVCRTRVRGAMFRSLFQQLREGGVAGHFMPIENSSGDDESTGDCFLQLELDRSNNALVAYLGNDKSVPGIRGVWSDSVLRFRGDFHDDITMWEVFPSIDPHITARPSTISLIVRRMTESIWLLDVAFLVEQSYPSQATPVALRCRLEFWNFRQRPGASIPHHPQDVEESFDEVLKRCDEATQDTEFRIDEINDLIASLEDSRAKCEEQLRLLGELKSNAESGKDDAGFLDDDMQEAILELHENPLVSAEGSAEAGEVKDILARTWSESDGLQADAESLETDIDSVESDIDLPYDDLIGSVWTNAQYARGERLMRENRNSLPSPDLSFLGPLQPSVNKLSKDAATFVTTAAVQFQMALRGEPIKWLDYGPQIASMAKACERILADVFEHKREAIARDSLVEALFLNVSSWQYRIPAGMSNVTSDKLPGVVRNVKKSIETNTAIKWTGMGQKRIALLLFGGWIAICQATREHILNPLGVNSSGEYVQALPDRLSEFQDFRNPFVHHDLADTDDLLRIWNCFQACLKGLLQAFD